MTYHQKFRAVGQFMKKLQHLLYQDQTVKSVFIPPPMISYRSARKISSYLVQAKLYPLESFML